MTEYTEQIKILCVDDERNVLRSLERLFLDDDYEIVLAGSGEEGLQLFESSGPFQVIISDYRMPVMNGGVFVRAARETGYRGLFIIYSGRGKDPLIDKARREGADVYIPRSGDFIKEFSSIKSFIYHRQMEPDPE